MIYSLLLVPLTIAPWVLDFAGLAYLATSTVLGAAFIYLALRVYSVREGRPADQEAKRLFVYSIFYLFVLFAVLLAEHWLMPMRV